MLRRIKRKAPPLPPSNGSNSSEPKARPTSEPSGKTGQNGKRTRKFGVITRTPASGKESKGGKNNPNLEQQNGHCTLMEMGGLQPETTETESNMEAHRQAADSPFPEGQYRSHLLDGEILDVNSSDLSLQVKKGLLFSCSVFWWCCCCLKC